MAEEIAENTLKLLIWLTSMATFFLIVLFFANSQGQLGGNGPNLGFSVLFF